MCRRSCFFIGHKEASAEIYPRLQMIIEQHITEFGVTKFIVGHYGAFDSLAAKAVIEAKRVHTDITLSLLLPYHPAERPIEKPDGFDNTYYPFEMEHIPRRFAIVKANQYMVHHVDYLIAYVCHPASNALNLLEYAQKIAAIGKIHITQLDKV